MIAKFLQEGKSIDYTTVAALAAGDVVPLTNRCGVAVSPIAALGTGALTVQGVFEVPKTGGSGGETFTLDEKLYWDAGSEVATASSGSGSNLCLGLCIEAAGATDTSVKVQLALF